MSARLKLKHFRPWQSVDRRHEAGAAEGDSYARDNFILCSRAGIRARRRWIISIAGVLFRGSEREEKAATGELTEPGLGK